jgi:hypothetical protein
MELFSFLHSRWREDACVVVILDEKRKAPRLAALLPNLASLLRPEMSPTICCAERWSCESIKIGMDVYQLWDEHIMETAPTLDIKRLWHVRSSFRRDYIFIAIACNAGCRVCSCEQQIGTNAITVILLDLKWLLQRVCHCISFASTLAVQK